MRLRFRLVDSKNLGIVLSSISEKLKIYSDNRFLSKVIIDVYNREIERYGHQSIEQVETIFSINSWEILNMLYSEKEYNRRWVNGIKIMDNLLNSFSLNNEKKYDLYQKAYLSLSKEFESNRSIKDELKKFIENSTKK